MNQKPAPQSNRYLIYRYVQALDSGNLDEIEMVLQAAQKDAELDHLVSEINGEYITELGLTPIDETAAQVRKMVERYFTQEESEDVSPLTVGDVAARMAGNQELPRSQRELSKTLLKNPFVLPDLLSIQIMRQIGTKLRLFDERYLRAFRDTALQMMMGRGQAQMAATRAKRSRRSSYRTKPDKTQNENKD